MHHFSVAGHVALSQTAAGVEWMLLEGIANGNLLLADLLAAGHETGAWDENGNPASWPQDVLDLDSGWHPAGGDDPSLDDQRSEPHSTRISRRTTPGGLTFALASRSAIAAGSPATPPNPPSAWSPANTASGSSRTQGPITETGNWHLLRLLVAPPQPLPRRTHHPGPVVPDAGRGGHVRRHRQPSTTKPDGPDPTPRRRTNR
jgi:hypothetical protein